MNTHTHDFSAAVPQNRCVGLRLSQNFWAWLLGLVEYPPPPVFKKDLVAKLLASPVNANIHAFARSWISPALSAKDRRRKAQ